MGDVTCVWKAWQHVLAATCRCVRRRAHRSAPQPAAGVQGGPPDSSPPGATHGRPGGARDAVMPTMAPATTGGRWRLAAGQELNAERGGSNLQPPHCNQLPLLLVPARAISKVGMHIFSKNAEYAMCQYSVYLKSASHIILHILLICSIFFCTFCILFCVTVHIL